jgi:hypothetical protein
MARIEVPRPGLLESVRARAIDRGPLLLTAPPGAGKTTLLHELAGVLSRDGWRPVYLDLMGAVSSPDRFVAAALDVLPADQFRDRLAQATEIRRLAGAGRERGADAVQALFALWSSLDQAAGRPVALLLDEATEIRSLAYFPGLRQAHKALATALGARRRGTVLATSFPTLARELWPGLDVLAIPPLSAADLAPVLRPEGLEAAAEALALASFGWPRHVRVLVGRLAEGADLVATWAEEMAAGGRLELACRHTYESLLLRSRGYGICKAVLAAVAREEGLNLTALVARLGRTPGATRDYLQWLVGVDALRVVKKRYYYVDGLVRHWVRLHGRGAPPTPAELLATAREVIRTVGPVPKAPETPPPDTAEPALPRRDTLMEID